MRVQLNARGKARDTWLFGPKAAPEIFDVKLVPDTALALCWKPHFYNL